MHRSAHAVKVFDYTANRAVVVTHMHGLRDLNGKMDTPERTQQANRFRSLFNQLTEKKDTVIVCGDFNREPNSKTFEILSDPGLIELVTSGTTKGTRNSQYKKKNRFADYMVVNEDLKILDFKVVFEPEVSDHCPILLTI